MEGILVTNVVATGLGRLCPCLIYGRQPLHSYIKIFHCRHPCLSNMIYLRNESIRCEALSVLISHHARLKYLCHSFFWRNESFMQTYNAGIPGQKWHLQSTMQWFDITPKTVDQSWNQVSFSCQFGQNDAFLIGTKRWVFYGKDWIGMRVSEMVYMRSRICQHVLGRLDVCPNILKYQDVYTWHLNVLKFQDVWTYV